MNNNLHRFLFGTLPKLLPAVCLSAFLVFEEIWICILIAAACFAYIYLVQIFVEKSRGVFSTYLYVVVALLILAWAEYQYRFLAGFLQ